MKKQQHFFVWIFGALMLLFSSTLWAQPTYFASFRSLTQTSCNTFEFDVYLAKQSTSPVNFQLAQFQMGILLNPVLVNGGTITVTPVSGSSGLSNTSQVPGPEKFSYDEVKNCIVITPVAPPGIGNGSLIAAGTATTGGTKFIRVRVMNSVPWIAAAPSLSWNFTSSLGYETKVFAYTTSNVPITTPATHSVTTNNGTAFNPSIAAPIVQTVTGNGQTYCSLSAGAPVGLAASQTGVAYELFKDGVSTGAIAYGRANNVGGAGTSITFGLWPEGFYQVKHYVCGTGNFFPTSATILPSTPAAIASISIETDIPGNVIPDPGTTVVTYTAIPDEFSATTLALIYWYVNDVNVGDGLTYAYTPAIGDVVKVEMYMEEGQCVAPAFVSSTMTMVGGVVEPLVFNVTGGGTVCAGDPLPHVLLSGSEVAFSYQLYNGAVAVGTPLPGTGAALDFGPVVAGTYTVMAGTTLMNGSAVVVVNALPVATIAADGPTTFCTGGSVTLTASPVGSYLWSNGATTPSITVSDAGSYTVTVTVAGCSDLSDVTVVTVNPIPVATIAADGPTTFCAGGSVTLTASPVGSYLWSNGATTPSITVSDAGTYSVTVTVAGCSDLSDATVVTVNPIPVATIAADGPTTFCTGGSVTLTASPVGSYLWSNGATTPSITVSDAGSYTVTVTVAGCSDLSEATVVTVNPIPVATITAGGPTTFCQGGFVVLSASAGDSWLWSNNETTQSITVTTGGVYSVQVTSLGCSATSLSTEVTVTPNVTPAVSIVADFTTVVAGTTVNFTATPVNGGTPSYQWYVNGGTAGTNSSSFSFVPVDGDDVYVVMTSSLGCVTAATAMSNTVTITVTAVILPPAAFNVTGGGAYCEGTGGLPVGLSGSEVGVTYTLTPGGATVAGTGAAVSFGSQLAGTYTATGSNGTYTTNMIGSAVITENPLPGPAGAISGLATVTEGTSGVAYSVVIPNATAAYWSYSGTGYVINGNGSASVTIDFAVGATSGTLSVFGQNDCGISGSVTLDITVDEIVVLVPVAATWNGSVNEDWFVGGNWTTEVGAVVPAATTTVLIPGGLTTYPTLTAPAACASFTINDGGSFIGSEFLTASSVLVKRNITNTKAHFVSTPVSGATIGGVFSNSLTVWAREYVALSGTWVFRYLTDPFVVGKGYNVSTTTPTVTANFVGALNTPPVFAGALSTANGGWNLLGNPYTSAIDWDGVVLNNVSASVAVWDGFNILGAPTAGYRYYSSSTGIGTFGFTGIIPAENGFFVTATGASASIDMPAATRVHSTAPFFKGSLANVLRVNVAGNSLNDETVIHFENAATANFDNFDGKKLDSDASLFSVVNGDRLWLNSFPLEGNEVVDLGFKANADGEYTFTASGIESFDGFTPVLLEDLKLNKVQDLRQNANYSFSYVNGDSENRFKLHFKNANGMGDLNTTGISVYSLDKSVVINNNTQLAGEVWIYDVTGRELIHTSMSSDAKTIIPVKAPTANYMVKVVTANGSVNQKVFIR